VNWPYSRQSAAAHILRNWKSSTKRDERPWSREAATEAIEIVHALNAHLEHHGGATNLLAHLTVVGWEPRITLIKTTRRCSTNQNADG
jgi:hypothetical protein